MNKKERIVHAAIEVFQEKGIERTKVSDIVKIAGIAQGTFYLYFPSKLSVMPAIAEVMVEKMMSAVQSEVNNADSITMQLRQIVDAIFQVTRDHSEVMTLIYAGISASDMKKWELIYEPFYSWVSDFLQKAKESGEVRQTVTPERTSKLMIVCIEAAADQLFLYDTVEEREIDLQKEEFLLFLGSALGIRE